MMKKLNKVMVKKCWKRIEKQSCSTPDIVFVIIKQYYGILKIYLFDICPFNDNWICGIDLNGLVD